MSDIRNGKVTEKKRLNRVGATPLFGGESAQKFRGVTPTLHVRRKARCKEKGKRHAASHPEKLRASCELRMLRSRHLRQMRNRTRCGSFHATQRITSVLLS
jgi:hypothetical protein